MGDSEVEMWQQELWDAIFDSDELAKIFPVCKELRETSEVYPLRITRHYLGLIREPGDPIWRQCIPHPAELEDFSQLSDPLHEEELSPVTGLIHRYPDRVVWLVSPTCAVFCRFCMRKRQFGCGGSPHALNQAAVLEYLAAHSEVRDIVLSGGDPLLLADDVLDDILVKIRKIPHIEMIRIGTRVPVTLPSRITGNLCRMLAKHHPLYINTHFNHPTEIGPASAAACGKLADAGIQLGNQSVLLRGVNDSTEVMRSLVRRLLSIRVRPYYLHQMDLVRGTAHFRTGIARGLEILTGLRGHVSGLGIPHYVVDLPGGKGKVPVLPEDAHREGNTWFFRNYLGEVVEYRDVAGR